MADTTTELEVLDEIVDVLGGQSGQYETVVPTLQQILTLLGGGGSSSGYNPSLSVGRADALTGADSTAQWATRVSEGSGSATVRSVQGAAVAWNQLYFRETGSGTVRGISYTIDANGLITLNGTVSQVGYILAGTTVDGKAGHKYLMHGHGGNFDVNKSVFSLQVSGGNDNANSGLIVSLSSDASLYPAIALKNVGDTLTNVTFRPQLIDLTTIFGAGNEPTTVAEFERMYPEPYYPYSAPTLKPVQIAGIASTDAQGGELDAIEWTAQTLRAAGSVRDELTADELVTRVGVVDLGALNWSVTEFPVNSGIYRFTSSQIDGALSGIVANLRCAPYNADLEPLGGNSHNNAIVLYNTRCYLRDDGYTDAATYKAAMSGVYLFYELATPTTTPITPALPMSYKVEQGGSESIIVPDGEISAAPILTVAEGESAAGLVMDALACIATPDGPVATANHSVGTYLTMGGKLYKVTSAIAVGESIAAGTNVTQTTVMAELLALTA